MLTHPQWHTPGFSMLHTGKHGLMFQEVTQWMGSLQAKTLVICGTQAPFGERVKAVRVPGMRRSKDSSQIVSLSLLPESRLLLLGSDDGFVRVCS